MRNLILHQTHLQSLLSSSSSFICGYYIDEFSKIIAILDSELKILIFTYENSDIFSNFILKSTIDLEEIVCKENMGIEILNYLMDVFMNASENSIDSKNSPIKLFLYKSEEESVHIILDSGFYINININSLSSKCTKLTESKILCTEISPNLENILMVTSDFKIVLLNYDFEFLLNCDLDDGDGTDITKDNSICEEASASWRGDSSFFCVLYKINGGRKCLVRDNKLKIVKGPARADNKVVFSVAESPSKSLSNLVSWQPSGSLIAYFQENTISLDNNKINDNSLKSGVLFTEKNCLRHGEFWLDKNNTEKITAKFLKWNLDLPILVIYFDSINLVSIYLRSNYDWTLKYSFYLPPNEKIFSIKFSDAVSLRLIILLTNGNFHSTDFKLEYQNSLNNFNFSEDNGTVSVISGNKIKLTPLGNVNIPPPMSLETINLPDNRQPPFILSSWKNYMFVMSDNGIDYIQINNEDRSYKLIDCFFNNESNNIKFNTRFVKNFIFTTNDGLTSGYFLINKILPNDYHHDELLIINFCISFSSSSKDELKFIKFISTNTIKVKRCLSLFNSVLSEELYNKNFYKNRDFIITETTTGIKEVENKSNKQNLNNKEESDNLFFGLVGLDKEGNKNKTSSKYFYMINFNNNNKEKSISKIFLDKDVEEDKKSVKSFNSDNSINSLKDISDTQTSNQINLKFEETNIYTKFDIIKVHSVIVFNNEEKVIYLTKTNRLFMDNTLLALDVTSFEYFKHFLLFTQTSNTPYNTLHIIDLNKKDFLNVSNNNTNNKNELIQNTHNTNIPITPLVTHTESLFVPNFNYKTFTIRTIERSALIVTVSKVNLVLQMSRGNLETIYPRLLVLNLILELIRERRDYKQAFELGRKHKINTNFIYDVDPEGFLKNIPKFLNEVNKSDYINLFLNGLENSICEEMLQLDSDLNSKEDFKKLYIYNKINKVCDEMRKELVLINQENKYLTSILHTHTKKNPQELLDALKLVQSLKIEEKNKLKIEELISSGGNKKVTRDKSHPLFSADKALEYLCWVVNAETLLDFALKTYDFELVIMVAKNTQKDPKEYLPYLKKLQDMSQEDPILMKYQINMDLKMYDDALAELSVGKNKYFEKCLDLINKFELYELAFSLFYQDETLFCEVNENYANYLKNVKKNTSEAAWAYLRSKNYKAALSCFIDIGSVNEVVTILNFDNLDKLLPHEMNIFEILTEIIDICMSSKKVTELEKIYLFVIENEDKLKKLSEDHLPHSLVNIQSKLMEGLIRVKKWKSAYLFYSKLLLDKQNKTADKDSTSSSGQVITNQDVLKEFTDGLNLSANLQLNELKKNLNLFEDKYNRLLKVQHLKRTQPHLFNIDLGDKNLQDNVSDSGSVCSSFSKNSGVRSQKSSMTKSSKKTKKSKAKISKRNVKEGSPLEEEYLIEVLLELKLSNSDIELIREFITILDFMKNPSNVSDCDELNKIFNLYLSTVNKTCDCLLSVAQKDFIDAHPEIKELFPSLNLAQIEGANKKVEGVGMKIFKTTSG